MPALSDLVLRIARPTRDLIGAERFWTEGVGLVELWRTPDGEDHPLLMVGPADGGWHLELVGGSGEEPRPTPEDLLVLYLGEPVPEATIDRIEGAGGRRVPAANPYWDRWGVTFEDPDGYRLVLSTRSWD